MALQKLILLPVMAALLTFGCSEPEPVEVLPDTPYSESDAQLTDGPAVSQPAPAPELTPPPEVGDVPSAPPALEPEPVKDARTQVLEKYHYVDPKRLIPNSLLETAILYYDENLTKITNKKYLSVIDFSKRSTLPRFFIINMETGSVWAIRTSHGKGSDGNHDGYAEKFSNVPNSNASSLGFYRTAETYSGKHGYSLRLDGLSRTNSNARSRAVVIHGADYVKEAEVVQGRSWGCPAIAQDIKSKVIDQIKGGSLIFAGLSAEQ